MRSHWRLIAAILACFTCSNSFSILWTHKSGTIDMLFMHSARTETYLLCLVSWFDNKLEATNESGIFPAKYEFNIWIWASSHVSNFFIDSLVLRHLFNNLLMSYSTCATNNTGLCHAVFLKHMLQHRLSWFCPTIKKWKYKYSSCCSRKWHSRNKKGQVLGLTKWKRCFWQNFQFQRGPLHGLNITI